MTNANKNHLAEILRTLQLSIPVIVGMVAGFSMNFVDTLMAGRLPDKEIALSAIATGGAIWSAALMFLLGILMGLQPVVAQLDGAGDQPEAGRATRQGFWIAIGVSVPFTGGRKMQKTGSDLRSPTQSGQRLIWEHLMLPESMPG